MRRKQIWWIACVVFITVAVSCAIYWRRDPLGLWDLITMPQEGHKVVLVTKDGKHSLYIKRRSWGITGSRQVVVISESARFFHSPDTAAEYHYHGANRLFYTFENDTLRVYSYQPSRVPPDLHTPIAIIQIKLNSQEFYDLNTTYEQKGVKAI